MVRTVVFVLHLSLGLRETKEIQAKKVKSYRLVTLNEMSSQSISSFPLKESLVCKDILAKLGKLVLRVFQVSQA